MSELGRSEQLGELFAALAKAQGAMEHAAKDRTNPHFKSRYATLSSCLEACRKPLSDNGLAVTQPVTLKDGWVVVHTLLGHASGQWLSNSLAMPVTKQDAQGVGSAITYGRRYGLCALVGVAPDDDDDAHAATGQSRAESEDYRAAARTRPTPAPGTIGTAPPAHPPSRELTRERVDDRTGEVITEPAPAQAADELASVALWGEKVRTAKDRATAIAEYNAAPPHIRKALTAAFKQQWASKEGTR